MGREARLKAALRAAGQLPPLPEKKPAQAHGTPYSGEQAATSLSSLLPLGSVPFYRRLGLQRLIRGPRKR